MAAIAADPERFARDPRIPDDPELAVMCHEALRAQAERDRRRAERRAADASDAFDDNPWA